MAWRQLISTLEYHKNRDRSDYYRTVESIEVFQSVIDDDPWTERSGEAQQQVANITAV